MQNEITEELYDVYDIDGNPTGQVLPKSEIHKNALLHRTVHIYIANSKKEILLQKRAATKVQEPGMWTCHGGHISAGETPLTAVCRETKEEIGLDIKPEELVLLKTYHKCTAFLDGAFTENEITDLYILIKDVDVDALVVQTDEVQAVHFFSLDAIAQKTAFDGSPIFQKSEEFPEVLEFLSRQTMLK